MNSEIHEFTWKRHRIWITKHVIEWGCELNGKQFHHKKSVQLTGAIESWAACFEGLPNTWFLYTHLLFLIADDVRDIAKRYIRGDFLIDVLGAVPLQYLDCVSDGENSIYSKLNVMVCVFLVCVLVCVGARCLWSFSWGIWVDIPQKVEHVNWCVVGNLNQVCSKCSHVSLNFPQN